MDPFDQQPLERTLHDEVPVVPPRRKSRSPIVIVAAGGLLFGGAVAWWWTRAERSAPSVAVTSASEPVTIAPTDAPRTLPPLDQMDTFLRALLGALSANPDFARWLATDDLIRQMASGIERIARVQSPAADLVVLRPSGDISITRRQTTMTLDPASFERYARHAALVESLEARGVAEAYRTIQPRLDEAYRALGRTQGGVDAGLDAALQMLLDTPIPPRTIAVVPGKGATYAYEDPELERLAPIQKQLLRMGPDNVARIQARLRAIRAELARSDNRAR
jgi:hypothetical protein